MARISIAVSDIDGAIKHFTTLRDMCSAYTDGMMLTNEQWEQVLDTASRNGRAVGYGADGRENWVVCKKVWEGVDWNSAAAYSLRCPRCPLYQYCMERQDSTDQASLGWRIYHAVYNGDWAKVKALLVLLLDRLLAVRERVLLAGGTVTVTV